MKNMSRREFLGTAGAFAGILALAGCGSTGGNTASTTTAASTAAATGDLSLITAGKLTVGTSPDFPPFENLENDEYVGLDMDLAKALAEALTVTERLDDKERRARQGLVSRAVTIR